MAFGFVMSVMPKQRLKKVLKSNTTERNNRSSGTWTNVKIVKKVKPFFIQTKRIYNQQQNSM